MKRAWLAGVGLMMTMAFVACSGDDEFDGNGNGNENPDSGVSSSSGQPSSSSGGNGSSSGGSSSGESSSSGGSSSGESSSSGGSSSGESSSSGGSSSGESSSSGGSSSGGSSSGGAPVDPVVAACTAWAERFAQFDCDNPFDTEAQIALCVDEAAQLNGQCEDEYTADKQCSATLPDASLECDGGDRYVRLDDEVCAATADALYVCVHGPAD